MNVPKELKELNQWVHWKYQEKDGRKTKVPVQIDGTPASSTNKDTWTAFPEKRPHDGIGIVFANDLAGIDLDNAFENGKLKLWARGIVDYFDSYTEVSPSGNGIHILFWTTADFAGKKKYVNKEKHEAIECYKNGRYFTFTGDVFEGKKEVKTISSELVTKWFDKEFQKKEPEKIPSPMTSNTLPDDDTILNKIRLSKNGNKFQLLYDQGNWEVVGFSSQSEADFSLAGTLMFFCCNNFEVANRLFRRSKLYREKWDTKHGKETYGLITLKKAIRSETMNWLDPTSDDPQDLLANAVIGEIRIEKTSLGYLAQIPVKDGEAQFRFNQLSVSRDGIKALVSTNICRVSGDDSAPYAMRVDLLSQSAQSSLVTQYNNAFGNKKDGYNWALTVNNVFSALTERLAHENGSEGVLGYEYTEPEFMLYPFLQKNATNMVFAQGETGKTFWALYIGVALATGHDFFGYEAEKGHNILFVDYEDNKQVFVSRLHRICQGLKLKYEDVAKHFQYLNPLGAVKDNIEILRKDIMDKNITLAIFDAGGDACGGSPNDERLVIELFNALQTLPTTKLVIHHEPKTTAGLTNEQAAYGSAYWRNRTRVAWRLEKVSEDETAKIVKMSIAKKSNLGFVHPIHYRFEFESQTDAFFDDRTIPAVYFTVTDEPERPEFKEDDVVQYLYENGPCTLKDVCDGTDITRSTVQRALEKLVESGSVIRDGGIKGRGHKASYKLQDGLN